MRRSTLYAAAAAAAIVAVSIGVTACASPTGAEAGVVPGFLQDGATYHSRLLGTAHVFEFNDQIPTTTRNQMRSGLSPVRNW